MDRREFCAGVAGASVIPMATISEGKISPEEEPKEGPWKVVNVQAGQKYPEKVQAVLNDLEAKRYQIVGCEPVNGGYVQIYAKNWNPIQPGQV